MRDIEPIIEKIRKTVAAHRLEKRDSIHDGLSPSPRERRNGSMNTASQMQQISCI